MKKKCFLLIIGFMLFLKPLLAIDRDSYYVNTGTYQSFREFARGVNFFNDERYEAAIESFRYALTSNPRDKYIRYWYSRALYKNGYSDLAVNEWNNLEKMGYGDPIILSKINKYGTVILDEPVEETLSNFIYLRSFSQNIDFLENINQPIDIEVKNDGRLFVLDYSDSALKIFDVNGEMIKEITHGRRILNENVNWFTRIWQFITRVYPYEKLKNPRGFAFDSLDNIYIANTGADNILKYNSNGDYITNIAFSGIIDGALLGPSALAIDNSDKLYVADTGNNRISVFNNNGEFLLSFASTGTGDGELFRPSGIAVNDTSVYVADTGNARIVQFDVYGNYVSTIENEMFDEPRGLSFSTDGNLFIADGERVYYYNITYDTFTTLQNSERYTITPTSVNEGPDGSIYITDFLAGGIDIYIRKEEYYANLDVFLDRSYLSAYPTIVESVTVRDRFGNPIKGLNAGNFNFIENGTVSHNIAFYDAIELTQHRFVFLIEDSAEGALYENKMKDEIENFMAALSPEDEVLVIHYNDEISSSYQYTTSKLEALDDANNLTFTGGVSSLTDAIYEAIRFSGASFKPTSIIHFTSSSYQNLELAEFDGIRFEELADYAKNSSVSISHAYIGSEKSNYFYDLLVNNTYGMLIDTDVSLNYEEDIDYIKNIDFGKYYIHYKTLDASSQKGNFRTVLVRVEYRGMYGEEESGYIIP